MTEALERRLRAALDHGWRRVAVLLASLIALAGTPTAPSRHPGGTLTAPVRRAAFRLLRTVESMARRLIALRAFELLDVADETGSPGAPSPQTPAKAGVQGGSGPRRGPWVPARPGTAADDLIPAFRLHEPVPDLSIFTLVDSPDPVIAATEQPAAPRVPLTDARGLMRRIASLKAALDDVDASARRLNRWLAATGKPHNLRPGRPPGGRRKDRLDWSRLCELSDLVRALGLASRPSPPGKGAGVRGRKARHKK